MLLGLLAAAILPSLSASPARNTLPTNAKVRVAQRDDFGVKLKIGYDINSPEDLDLAGKLYQVSVCANCDVNDKGERNSNEGYQTVGSTCGGYPHGCAVLKRSDWIFEDASDTLRLHFRVGESVWSKEAVVFTGLNTVVQGEGGVVHLVLQETKEEL